MCYPVPDCDPKKVHKPMLAASTEEDTASRRDSYPYTLDQQGHTDQFSTTYHLPPNGNVPLFKSSPLDKEEQEDYDYGPTDFPETYPQSLLVPTQRSHSSKVISVVRGSDRPERVSAFQSFDRGSKLELVERYGVHDHAAEEEVTETPQSTVVPHMHEDTTTAWQHTQTSVQNVSFDEKSPWTDLENPLHAHTSLDSPTSPLNQGLEKGEKHSKYPHMISETVVNNSVTMAHHQNASDSVRPRGSNSQIDVSHQVGGAESQSSQQSQSESNSHKGLQYTVAPGSEEEVDENIMEEEQEEEIVTFQSVTESEGKDVPYKIKSAQQERRDKESESSDPNSSYQKTTPEPSTSSPREVEYHTTPTVPFIATATTATTTSQLPVKVKLDESQPSRKPGQRLFNLHSKDTQEVEEEVIEKEEERKDRPVLLIKPDGGE